MSCCCTKLGNPCKSRIVVTYPANIYMLYEHHFCHSHNRIVLKSACRHHIDTFYTKYCTIQKQILSSNGNLGNK